MATTNIPINWTAPEKLTLTKKEFRERFENEFKVFARCLKEIGKYKFVMKYMFSHRNKTKDDLFNTICKTKNGNSNVLARPSLAISLLYLNTLGDFPTKTLLLILFCKSDFKMQYLLLSAYNNKQDHLSQDSHSRQATLHITFATM